MCIRDSHNPRASRTRVEHSISGNQFGRVYIIPVQARSDLMHELRNHNSFSLSQLHTSPILLPHPDQTLDVKAKAMYTRFLNIICQCPKRFPLPSVKHIYLETRPPRIQLDGDESWVVWTPDFSQAKYATVHNVLCVLYTKFQLLPIEVVAQQIGATHHTRIEYLHRVIEGSPQLSRSLAEQNAMRNGMYNWPTVLSALAPLIYLFLAAPITLAAKDQMLPPRAPDFSSLAQGCKRLRKLSRFHVMLTHESNPRCSHARLYPGLLFAPLPPYSRQRLLDEEEPLQEGFYGPRPSCRTIIPTPIPSTRFLPSNPFLHRHFDATLGFEGEGPHDAQHHRDSSHDMDNETPRTVSLSNNPNTHNTLDPGRIVGKEPSRCEALAHNQPLSCPALRLVYRALYAMGGANIVLGRDPSQVLTFLHQHAANPDHYQQLLWIVMTAMLVRGAWSSLIRYGRHALQAFYILLTSRTEVPYHDQTETSHWQNPGERPSSPLPGRQAEATSNLCHSLVFPYLRVNIGNRFEQLARQILPMTHKISSHQNSLTVAFDLRFRLSISSLWQSLAREPSVSPVPALTPVQACDLRQELNTLINSLETEAASLSLPYHAALRLDQSI